MQSELRHVKIMALTMKHLYKDYVGKPLLMKMRIDKDNTAIKNVVVEDVTDHLVIGLEIPRDLAKADTAIILKEEIIYHVQTQSTNSLKEKIAQKKRFYDRGQSEETISKVLKRLNSVEEKLM